METRGPTATPFPRPATPGQQSGSARVRPLIKAACVRPSKFHRLRHTCATLLLQARQPVHVVAERLGHKKVEITLNIYAHVLPDMQQDPVSPDPSDGIGSRHVPS